MDWASHGCQGQPVPAATCLAGLGPVDPALALKESTWPLRRGLDARAWRSEDICVLGCGHAFAHKLGG